MSLPHLPWWFEDAALFTNAADHAEGLAAIDNELTRSHEELIQDHQARYSTDPRRPGKHSILYQIKTAPTSRVGAVSL